MADFDKLWNMNDPAGTELKFREVLAASSVEKDLSYHLQLLTQNARTYSLRFMFDEAHKMLDDVNALLPTAPEVAHVRYHLERGRAFNWQKNQPEAIAHFEKSRRIAEQLGEDYYTVDAIHMLAIMAKGDEAVSLTEDAIVFAEQSTSLQAKNWLGTLYNNLGWSYFDSGNYEKALGVFYKSLSYWEGRKAQSQIFIARWCVAKALRVLGRADEALTIQLALLDEMSTIGHPDGYVHEELGEIYLAQDDKLKYPPHFQKAYEMLSADQYTREFEAPRLERIKRLAGLEEAEAG